jgi:hypothetical protein
MTVLGATAGTTLNGPGGILISLGIETLSTMGFISSAMVTFYYNIFSIFVMMLIAISASQRDLKFMNILLPIWAGFCVLAGWLVYPNPVTGYAIVVVATMIAIGNYMTETLHEKNGIAGPGNKVILIFKFLVILQCVVVFVNSAAIFPSDVTQLAPSNPSYENIDLTTNLGGINSSGGLTSLVVDIATIAGQIAASSLLLVIKCIISLALFSVVLSQIFPWIVQAGAIGVAFLVVLQFAIWTMYLMFAFTIFYRPSPDPGY